MKVLCIEDVDNDFMDFYKGSTYEMIEKFHYNKQELNFDVYVVMTSVGVAHNFAESVFESHFLDIKRERKLKLEQLDNVVRSSVVLDLKMEVK